MSMYLPNPDLQPTGDEPAEFLEIPPMDQSPTSSDTRVEREEGSTVRADAEAQLDSSETN